MNLKDKIRDIPNFPHEGILFRDITPLLQDPAYLAESITQMRNKISQTDFDLIVAPESRGFIVGVPLAYSMNKGFVPARKAGKLPYETVSTSYDLEYGSAAVEIHADAITRGKRVIIADDLLATGGTCAALCRLIEQQGGIIAGIIFLIELEALNGREVIKQYPIHSILKY